MRDHGDGDQHGQRTGDDGGQTPGGGEQVPGDSGRRPAGRGPARDGGSGAGGGQTPGDGGRPYDSGRPYGGGARRRSRRVGEIIPPATPYARTRRIAEVTVVELRGEIDVGSAEFVAGHLDAAALWPPPLVVVLDLGPLEFIDCYGLSLLLRARRRVLDRGGTLRMACDHPPTRRLLALTGLDGVFRPFPTLAAALADSE